jgi:hypothetical protein
MGAVMVANCIIFLGSSKSITIQVSLAALYWSRFYEADAAGIYGKKTLKESNYKFV